MDIRDIAFATTLVCAMPTVWAATLCGGDSPAIAIDLRMEPMVESVNIAYDASWVGGDVLATIVISDNGAEVQRATGTGEFTHMLAGASRHELTYVTYIGGVAQEEIYQAVVFKDWKYEVVGGGAVITGSAIQSDTVSIPPTIDGYPVTGIASSAFGDNSCITSITIPNSVTNIGDNVFNGCYGLTSLTIGDGVTSIGSSMFKNFTNLVSVTIGNSVTNIGNNAFSGCYGLMSIVIGDGVTTIGDSMFYNFTNLVSVTIGNSVTNIGNRAFEGCSRLASVTIPDSVTSIGADAFYNCYGLVSLTIGNGVKNIGNYSFYNCKSITSVAIPNSIRDIGQYAFYNCYGLSSVSLGSGVGSIGNYAFYYCSSLTSMTIPTSVTNIGKSAFSGCSRLTSLFLPVRFEGIVSSMGIPSGCEVVFYKSLFQNGINSFDGKPLSLSSKDVVPWLEMADEAVGDGLCISSGETGSGEVSTVETKVSGPGRLSFIWRISAGRGDFARVYVDGVVRQSISRSTGWQSATLDIPSGKHAVVWSYERGSGVATGEDAAFLDDIDWRPQVFLSVTSAFGTATPADGTHALYYGDEVTASAVAPPESNGTRRVCTGWRGTGSIPLSGVKSSVSFAIKYDSTIVWNWRTDYRISLSTSAPASSDFSESWVAEGETVIAHLSPLAPNSAFVLSGDVEGVVLDEASLTLSIPADKPRAIALAVTELTLEKALDTTNIVWVTDGEATWFPQVAVSHDGFDAAKSGAVSGVESSYLMVTVSGPGVLSWFWRLDSMGFSGVDVWLDGVNLYWKGVFLEESSNWVAVSLNIVGSGEHEVVFEFWNAGTAATITDCAYIDQVSWTPSAIVEAIPPLQGDSPQAITNAIESAGFADAAAVMDAIGGDAEKYVAFKEWANAVKDSEGNLAGEAAVVDSPHAAVSWLLGAEALFENEPEIRIASLALANAQGTGNGEQGTAVAMTVTIEVKDGEDIVKVAEEKVAAMFEATSDLRDWDGAAKLSPTVSGATRNADNTMTFTVIPGDGTAKSAFLRVKVK